MQSDTSEPMTDSDAAAVSPDARRPVDASSARVMRVVTYGSVSVAIVLTAAKLLAWLTTDSVAMLSSLVDSLLDMVASLVTLFAVHRALRPADREFRFGYGKAEPLAGLVQALIFTGSVVFVLFAASRRMFTPVAVEIGPFGMAVMVFSIMLTIALVVVQRFVVRKTGSVAIKADSLHYMADFLTNVGVLVALILASGFGVHYADPLFAVAVALFILFSAWQIVRGSFDILLDREFPEDMRNHIREIAMSHPQVRDMHDMRTRSAGLNSFIQLHLELDSSISFERSHVISDEVEADIRKAFPNTDVIIHQDPEGIDEEPPEFD